MQSGSGEPGQAVRAASFSGLQVVHKCCSHALHLITECKMRAMNKKEERAMLVPVLRQQAF